MVQSPAILPDSNLHELLYRPAEEPERHAVLLQCTLYQLRVLVAKLDQLPRQTSTHSCEHDASVLLERRIDVRPCAEAVGQGRLRHLRVGLESKRGVLEDVPPNAHGRGDKLGVFP